MRLGLGLVLALLLAGPTSAQSRFVEGCMASAEAEATAGLDARAVCQCAADGTVARGVPAADLDALMGHVAEDGTVDPGQTPDEVQAVAAVMSEVLLACALAEGAASAEVAAASVGDAGRVTGAEVPAAPVRPTTGPALPPAGIRTGDGTAPTRTEQRGSGAAIRIVG